ncbi:MAG: aminotransferase class V-fold PLP-dependent enzyme [Rhodospirillaceae bacterium]|nr:aminotransferase class V-fold PLP-dependent enzyme [Rhodospirillaceae bacterium]
MLSNQRHLFDVPDEVTYLNCAAHTPLLNSVRQAGTEGLDRKYHPWDIDASATPAEAEKLRGLFAGLIGAKAGDVAIVNSTSYGIETAARNVALAAGQKILMVQDQFPSNVLSWRHLATEKGGEMAFVPRPTDGDWTAAILGHLDGDVAIAALPPCHWSDGSSLDLVAIGARCREVGAAFVIDATQVIGAKPFYVNEIQPDFVACSGYKWLCCPYTLGFLYAAPHRQNGTPLEFHRWNHEEPNAVATETGYPADYNSGARRYDMGEINNFIHMPMAVAALTQVAEWTPAAIQNYLTPLTDAVAEGAEARGWVVPVRGKRVGHYIGMVPPQTLSPEIVPRLQREANVHVSQRGAGVRVSPHLFNDGTDIERFFEALDSVLAS